jgi:restriction system protein
MSGVRERDSEPAAWLVRGGEHGEREEIALSRGLVIAGWEELGSISDCESREGIRQALTATYPEVSDKVIGNWTGQLWRFKGVHLLDKYEYLLISG